MTVLTLTTFIYQKTLGKKMKIQAINWERLEQRLYFYIPTKNQQENEKQPHIKTFERY